MENKEYAEDENGKIVVCCVPVRPKLPPIKLNITQNKLKAVVRYDPHFFPAKEATRLYRNLLRYNSRPEALNDGGNMYGNIWKSDRKTIQISDPNIPIYKYTGSSAKVTEPYVNYPTVEYIREVLQDHLGERYRFNFCLYNSYTPGAKLGWHSDAEANMVPGAPIASLSFNFRRRFRVRDTKTHEIYFDEFLESGSLLLMEEDCQELTEHCVWNLTEKELEKYEGLPAEEITRINLTYRIMYPITKK